MQVVGSTIKKEWFLFKTNHRIFVVPEVFMPMKTVGNKEVLVGNVDLDEVVALTPFVCSYAVDRQADASVYGSEAISALVDELPLTGLWRYIAIENLSKILFFFEREEDRMYFMLAVPGVTI